MDIEHDLCFVHVHPKTYSLGDTIEVIEHGAYVLQRFCHKDYIVGKSKVSDVLAIDVNTVSFPVQKHENVFQCSGEEFRGYNITLSYTSLQLDRFRTLVLYSDSHRSSTVQTLQHFDIPIRLRCNATMEDGIKELLKDFKYRSSTRFQKLRCNSILAWGLAVFKVLESQSNLAQTDVRDIFGIVSDKTRSWIVTYTCVWLQR
ncbi:unnamed protein product [Parnassius mnemosyne]|uniref:Uncharacterized protein n=1 Tax=Parnassius mnemosyne TaxID=213953 RepID=A0AAV1KND4_9NEOP